MQRTGCILNGKNQSCLAAYTKKSFDIVHCGSII